MDCCQTLVLDEVDILTGEASFFLEQVRSGRLLMRCSLQLQSSMLQCTRGSVRLLPYVQVEPILQAARPNMRAILVTASLSQLAWLDLQNKFPSIKPVLGPGLHRQANASLGHYKRLESIMGFSFKMYCLEPHRPCLQKGSSYTCVLITDGL